MSIERAEEKDIGVQSIVDKARGVVGEFGSKRWFVIGEETYEEVLTEDGRRYVAPDNQELHNPLTGKPTVKMGDESFREAYTALAGAGARYPLYQLSQEREAVLQFVTTMSALSSTIGGVSMLVPVEVGLPQLGKDTEEVPPAYRVRVQLEEFSWDVEGDSFEDHREFWDIRFKIPKVDGQAKTERLKRWEMIKGVEVMLNPELLAPFLEEMGLDKDLNRLPSANPEQFPEDCPWRIIKGVTEKEMDMIAQVIEGSKMKPEILPREGELDRWAFVFQWASTDLTRSDGGFWIYLDDDAEILNERPAPPEELAEIFAKIRFNPQMAEDLLLAGLDVNMVAETINAPLEMVQEVADKLAEAN